MWVNICFLFVQQTTTQKKTNLGILPLHAQVFALFDTLCDDFHKCNFDHLYMSAKFLYTYFTQHPKTFKVREVFRVGGWEVSKEFIQYEVIDTKNSTWLGRSCLFLFLTDYYQVQTLFCYFFLLIAETPSRHLCWNASVI